MMRVNVQHGTNAGWRTTHPKHTDSWQCARCGRVNQPFVVRCLTVGCDRQRP